jgi:hypothetical protein
VDSLQIFFRSADSPQYNCLHFMLQEIFTCCVNYINALYVLVVKGYLVGWPLDNGPSDYHMSFSATFHSTCVGSNAQFYESRLYLRVHASTSVTRTRMLVNLTVNYVMVRGGRFLLLLRTIQGSSRNKMDLTFCFLQTGDFKQELLRELITLVTVANHLLYLQVTLTDSWF